MGKRRSGGTLDGVNQWIVRQGLKKNVTLLGFVTYGSRMLRPAPTEQQTKREDWNKQTARGFHVCDDA
jgi:hypothetical protein